MVSMPSEHIQLLIAGYVLGDLDPDEAAEFEQLLAENPAIVQEVARVQKTLELSYAPSAVMPPTHLRSKILNVADDVAKSRDRPSPAPTSRQLRFPWGKVMAVAAAVLLVALGINNYRLWQTLQTIQAQRQPSDPLTYSLQGTKVTSTASATVVVNPNKLEATLSVRNLPPLPPGKVYVLWTVVNKDAPFTTDDKGAILTEVFRVNAQGNFSETIIVPEVYRSNELVTKVAVTMEDASSPQKHTGSVLMVTDL